MKTSPLHLLVFLIVAAFAGPGAGPARAEPALRPAATVERNVILLGDLFSDAGVHAGDVVAPAPPPGSRTIFDAAWLAAAAREHQLAWQPGSSLDRTSVERATRLVTGEQIAQRLLDEMARRQSVDGAEIQLDDAGLRLLVAREAPDSIAVEGLTVDARSGRFTASVAVPADDAAAERRRVAGRLIRMTRLAVLSRPIAPGEVIRTGDVEFLPIRSDRAAADLVVDARELIGKTPRRPLRAHEPLRGADVQTPVIVRKGDLVTIVLETPNMRLTAQGKALEDGSMGAAIRIANTKSDRVIDATVTGANAVAVAAAAPLAARQETTP
jgi:flagellar basal body P-ring formation protein FlgA